MAKKVKITVTASLSGRFLMPYNPGQEISVSEELAKEIVDAGYAVYTSAKKAADKVEAGLGKEESSNADKNESKEESEEEKTEE
jgi:hypothetical protein